MPVIVGGGGVDLQRQNCQHVVEIINVCHSLGTVPTSKLLERGRKKRVLTL